jgi:NADPH:quinone reductase-like Zn-dependent oxidoreductase
VDTFAVQIAKSYGAEVTGVQTRNSHMVRSIEADHVIDYTTEDFTEGDQCYDLMLDNVGTVRKVVDRTYPLNETPEALRYLEQVHARGRVVITV